MTFPNVLQPSGAVFIGGDEANAFYRPLLWRWWGPGISFVHFCALNPSTAGHTINDPTIRREIDFAKRWGFDGLLKTNAFDWRATDPKEMMRVLAPMSVENDAFILGCHKRAAVSVAAWGVHATHNNRCYELKRMLSWQCLGVTKDGHPRHPLYLKATTTLIPLA